MSCVVGHRRGSDSELLWLWWELHVLWVWLEKDRKTERQKDRKKERKKEKIRWSSGRGSVVNESD